VVLVVDTTPNRNAVLFRTDVDLDALPIARYYKARFPIELLCRDAKQCTGVTDSQARSHAKRPFHGTASLSAGTLAQLEARQHTGNDASGFSMATLKRRAFHQPLVEHMSQH
jgi:hypothetical protein